MERIETELSSSSGWGSPPTSWWWPTSASTRGDRRIALGPGRGSATGSMVAYAPGITELDPLEHSLLFERFLNPDVCRSARHRPRLRRPPARRHDRATSPRSYGEDTVAQSTRSARSRPRPRSRTRRGSSATRTRSVTRSRRRSRRRHGQRDSAPRSSTRSHPRYNEAARCGQPIESDPDVRKVV